MRVPVRWLLELTGVEMPTAEMARLLSAKGISVEEIVRIAEAFAGAVVAEVVEAPANRATLFDGKDVFETETGPARLKADEKVAFDPESKRIVRESDIGIEGSAEYIRLPAGAETGSPARKWVDDEVLVVELPPSRGDLTGVIGIAREFACFAGREFVLPPVAVAEDQEPVADCFRLEVRDRADTPDYIARLVKGVRVAASPFWLKWRLVALGIRPISNAVDVTNYVMLKYGQPLHGFDFRKLHGGTLITRRARKGEEIATIDGVTRALDDRVLVIADDTRPVAIAGVMGGAASEITDATQDVLIECARFAPAVIRHGSRAIGLVTEASQRFELGIDPGQMEAASREAAALMRDIGGGRVLAGKAEVRSDLPKRTIAVSWDRTRRLLGMDISGESMSGVLRALGFGLRETPEGAAVDVPSFRFDVEGAADLAEEVGRVVGFDRIPSDPTYAAAGPGVRHIRSRQVARIRELMIAEGFSEVQSLSFLPEASVRAFDALGAITLLKPLNERCSALRPSLLPGLLEALSLNLRRGNRDLRLFEIGTVYAWSAPDAEGKRNPVEMTRLSTVMCGSRDPLFWGAKPEGLTFFDIKGVACSLLKRLRVENPVFGAGSGTGFAEGASARIAIGGAILGNLGQIAGSLAAGHDISEPVYALDLNLSAVSNLPAPRNTYQPLPRFPPVVRDYAFVVATTVSADRMLEVARRAAGELVAEAEVFDRFQGRPLAEGSQSVGLRLTLRAPDRTLTAREVDDITTRLVARFRQELGAELRA
jgi:phenylalanyl-tRNA synthetase beta chain